MTDRILYLIQTTVDRYSFANDITGKLSIGVVRSFTVNDGEVQAAIAIGQ